MRRRLDAFGGQRLHPLGMFEDVFELMAVAVQLIIGERDASELGDLGDVDVDRHGGHGTGAGVTVFARAYRCPMLPMPSRDELRRRLPRLLFGLLLYGIGVALLVEADLGLAPWEVLHQGISFRTGIPIGTVGILTGLVVLLLWIPLGEKIGLGTVLNVILIGIVIDLTLWWWPRSEIPVTWQWVLLIGGTVTVALGSGFYIGAGLGPGPRDGLMTGLGKRGIPIGWARAGIELTVLLIGYLLGGTVGIGTLVFAFGIGPLVAVFLPRLTITPAVAGTPDRTELGEAH